MKARISNSGNLAETFEDEFMGEFADSVVIVDIPDEIKNYLVDAEVTYDLDNKEFLYDMHEFARRTRGKVANFRWQRENSGVKVEGISFNVPTTVESLTRISHICNGYNDGDLDLERQVSFIVGQNFTKIGHDKALEIRKAILLNQQELFDKQLEAYEAIDKIEKQKTKPTLLNAISKFDAVVKNWLFEEVAVATENEAE